VIVATEDGEVDLQGCKSGGAPGAGAMDEISVSTDKIGLSRVYAKKMEVSFL